jgi:hypothetical protein
MNHARNENVQLHWQSGDNLAQLLVEAAGLTDSHDGYSEVHSHFDYETGGYEVTVYCYG